jgi:hypothetical protein
VTTLRLLLGGLIDYAGLFPPAGLSMAEAVRLYASYRRGRSAWALGRFVLPVARLAEFSDVAGALLPAGEGAIPWLVSALVGPDPARDLGEVLAFNARHARIDEGRARVDAVEVRVATAAEVGAVARVFDDFSVAYEVQARGRETEDALDAVQAAGGMAKLRTGGVTEEAFPEISSVASFLWACAQRRVAFKLTAGLHHPLRGEYALTYEEQSPRGVMHGLLNVLVAALAARRLAGAAGAAPATGERGEVPSIVASILAESDARAFALRVSGVAWRTEVFSSDEVESARATFAVSIGSCSFEEPLSELGALGWQV